MARAKEEAGACTGLFLSAAAVGSRSPLESAQSDFARCRRPGDAAPPMTHSASP